MREKFIGNNMREKFIGNKMIVQRREKEIYFKYRMPRNLTIVEPGKSSKDARRIMCAECQHIDTINNWCVKWKESIYKTSIVCQLYEKIKLKDIEIIEYE